MLNQTKRRIFPDRDRAAKPLSKGKRGDLEKIGTADVGYPGLKKKQIGKKGRCPLRTLKEVPQFDCARGVRMRKTKVEKNKRGRPGQAKQEKE